MFFISIEKNGKTKKIFFEKESNALRYYQRVTDKKVDFEVKFLRKNNSIIKNNETITLQCNDEVNTSNIKREEKFKVYGEKNRMCLSETLSALFLPRVAFFSCVYLYGNKVIVDDMDEMDIILCKNVEDSIRLYNTYKKILYAKKIYNFLFLGEITKKNFKKIQSRLSDKTKIDKKNFSRKTSR